MAYGRQRTAERANSDLAGGSLVKAQRSGLLPCRWHSALWPVVAGAVLLGRGFAAVIKGKQDGGEVKPLVRLR